MSANRLAGNSLRPRENMLLWAFCISIALHLFLYADWKHLQRLKFDLFPAKLHLQNKTAELKKNQPPPETERQVQLEFVDVDPAAATKEAPKDAKYYSSHNSRAANTDTTIDTAIPKISGSQTHVAKTETAPRAKPVPLQPAPPKQTQPSDESTEAKAKPKGGPQIGDLAMAKPMTQPGANQSEGDTGEADKPMHVRPRTLNEAKARQAPTGEKMKQDGGVSRHLELDSLDARATPFGEYDRELIDAIKSRWYDLLNQKEFSRDRTGKVVVDFRLDYSGRITDLKVVQTDVDDLLAYVCEKAISDPAPFAPWPSDMRRLVGADYREVRFTFFYE